MRVCAHKAVNQRCCVFKPTRANNIGLDFWLYSIQARAPKCPVLVVGTRIDEVPYQV